MGSSVSKTTTILVLGADGAGSTKHQAALKYGVKILNESELNQLVAQVGHG